MTYGKFSAPPPVAPNPTHFPKLNGVVTVENCYYYLSFLERFWTFMDTMTLQEQRHYLARAEVRYEKWIHNHFSPMLVPPLDIAFMWHVHKLSPFRCYEDLVLRLPCKKLFDDPLPLYDLFKNEDLTPNDLKRWKQTFGEDEPYHLTNQNMYSGTFQRPCYRCRQVIELPWSNYYDYRFGANHTRFPHDCAPVDGINFWDVARMKLESDLMNGPVVAGTLLNPNGSVKVTLNKMIAKIRPIQVIIPQNEMDYAYERQIQEQLKFLGPDYEYDANELLYAIRTSYQGNPSPFSNDLIQAVARQRKFYSNITSIHWQYPISYMSAIRRYHDHLALIKMHPNHKAIPTIEIDVAFHTHMMDSLRYHKFTIHRVGKLINHDDDIPESSIRKHLSEWQTLWSNLQHRSIEHRYKFTKTRATDELVEGTLKVTPSIFPTTYQPGMVRIRQGKEARNLYTTLNEELVRSNNTKATMISIHSKGKEK
ncbi:uncharacterized protein BX664DRAFT_343423 [Halteromyces radiatus]|uniref:uncharacterized protein n=1 Tax=Halteromyces radiatus TaxID=101107 RepID=UPI00221EB607|nr:uncharacterized protein BX664DRAFT_343423 [Halteromyces radiatus]KAI8077763.1 hypothetical protein BX664DRAFT_343423 [Halteromyces radiatus]